MRPLALSALVVRTLIALPLAAAALSACGNDDERAPSATACVTRPLKTASADFFKVNTAKTHLDTNNVVLNPPKPIPSNGHPRLAMVDLNGDGWDDCVAHTMFPNVTAGIPFDHLILRNNKDGTFTDVSAESGLKDVQAGVFAFGDFDNDGDQDCFAGLDTDIEGVTSKVYLNDGMGHFAEKPLSGVEKSVNHTSNAVIADFDGDAKLDLFVGNGQSSFAEKVELYFGNGDGTFRNVSTTLAKRTFQPTNGMVACDYDNDGDLDVFAATYGVSINNGWNHLWENDGAGGFTDVAVDRGFHALATGNYFLKDTGYGRNAEAVSADQIVGSNGFGIDCGDFDNDGAMDIYLAAISHADTSANSRMWSDPTQLLSNGGADGSYAFKNVFLDRGLPFNEGDIDASMTDYDNDGRLDLAVTRDDKYESNFKNAEQKGWMGLFHQKSDNTFESVGLTSGINDVASTETPARMKRGGNIGFSDMDHDGDFDLVVGAAIGGAGRANVSFENTLGQDNTWLALHLKGDGIEINRDAIGTRVTISYGNTRVIRERRASRGTYNALDGSALLFGLGGAATDKNGNEVGACVDNRNTATMTVRWPNGKTETFAPDAFPLGKYLSLTYGTGKLVTE